MLRYRAILYSERDPLETDFHGHFTVDRLKCLLNGLRFNLLRALQLLLLKFIP